jgi:hypothetical protein
MVEVAFVKIKMECMKIENLIVVAKQEIQMLEVKEKTIER